MQTLSIGWVWPYFIIGLFLYKIYVIYKFVSFALICFGLFDVPLDETNEKLKTYLNTKII